MGWLRCNNIDPVYQTNVMSLLNFFTTFKQGFGYVNIQPWIARILRSLRFLVKLMSVLQRCTGVAITTSMICCKANLLPNVETMLDQRQNFDMVASESLQRYVLDLRRRGLTTALWHFALLLGSNQWKIFSHFYFWKWILKNGRSEASPLNSKYCS